MLVLLVFVGTDFYKSFVRFFLWRDLCAHVRCLHGDNFTGILCPSFSTSVTFCTRNGAISDMWTVRPNILKVTTADLQDFHHKPFGKMSPTFHSLSVLPLSSWLLRHCRFAGNVYCAVVFYGNLCLVLSFIPFYGFASRALSQVLSVLSLFSLSIFLVLLM